MSKKRQFVKKIDLKTKSVGGGLPFIQEDQILSPAPRTLPAPDTVTFVAQGIQRSTQAPLAYVAISWNEAPNISPDYYNVEWDVNSSFNVNPQRKRAVTTSATITDLAVNTTYYFRVQAVIGGMQSDYSDVLSVLTTTDTTVPPDVTGLSATFINGDLFITWTNPVSEVFKSVDVKIYNGAHSILLDTYTTAAQQLTWTADKNINASGGVATTSVSIDVLSRSWSNVVGAAPVNTTASSAVPNAPTSITSSWDGDTGTAAADVVISWLGNGFVESYDISLDGVAYSTKDTRFTYRYDRNVADHVPTLKSGDAVLSYQLRSKNKLGQQSAIVSGTLTNAAPSGALLSVTATPGFSLISAQVSLLSGAIIQDFDHYTWTLVSGSVNIQQFNSTTPDVVFQVSGSGTYRVKVKAVDKFNQASGDVITSALTMDVLTIAQLRAEAYYTDNLGRSSPTLDVLKDDDITSFAIYPSGAWNWTKVERPTIDRYGVVSIYCTAIGTVFYVGLSSDDITYTWYSGPLTGTNSNILTLVANESAAQSNAVAVPAANRVDIPTLKDARFIKIGHQNPSTTYFIYTLYPRRIVESDDIRAENIKAINIAAATITADKIAVFSLTAATASIAGVISIGTSGGIYQGTGSFASPTTGLKVFNSGGVGKLSTYNTGVEQITLDTDGKFKAGAGAVILDAGGIQIIANNDLLLTNTKNIRWVDGSSNLIGAVNANYAAALNDINIVATNNGSRESRVYLEAQGTSSNNARFQVVGSRLGVASTARMYAEQNEVFITKSTGWFEVYNASTSVVFSVDNSGNIGADGNISANGLNLGNGTGAAAGQIRSSDSIIITGTLPGSAIQIIESNAAGARLALFTGEPGVSYQTAVIGYNYVPLNGGASGRLNTSIGAGMIRFTQTNGTIDLLNFDASGNVNYTIRADYNGGPRIAFLGITTPVARQNVTGSRGGNAALASLLTAMAAFGLITNSTTA